MHTHTYADRFCAQSESYLKQSGALWQHVCEAGLLFSVWERTCGWQWYTREPLFPIDALCCCLWKQRRNMVNLWKWLWVKSCFSKVRKGGECVSEKAFAQRGDGWSQVHTVEGMQGIVPSAELTSGYQWSTCPCPEKKKKSHPWRGGYSAFSSWRAAQEDSGNQLRLKHTGQRATTKIEGEGKTGWQWQPFFIILSSAMLICSFLWKKLALCE